MQDPRPTESKFGFLLCQRLPHLPPFPGTSGVAAICQVPAADSLGGGSQTVLPSLDLLHDPSLRLVSRAAHDQDTMPLDLSEHHVADTGPSILESWLEEIVSREGSKATCRDS